jgi:hypothetical protein
MELHDAVGDLGFLLGTWRGAGTGHYPTIDDFAYGEEIEIGHIGKPFLSYTQKAQVDGAPSHAETGYYRPGPELLLAQPSGIVEIHTGTLDGQVLDLEAILVQGTPTAKEVLTVRRRIEVDGDTMRYDVSMGAVGQPLQHHLNAELHRV